MILNNDVYVHIYASNINYWKTKLSDPNISVGQKIEVCVNDLPPKSNMMIDCVCDSCRRNYSQRRNRNLDVCGYCLSSNRMKNNGLGKKNVKYICTDVDALKFMVDRNITKKDICSHFNIDYQTLNRWLKENDLSIMSHRGNSIFNSDIERGECVSKIKKLIDQNKTIRDIIDETGLTRQVIKTLIQNNNLSVANQFNVWQRQYTEVLSNMELYVQENSTKTLLEISSTYNISIEHLKKAFNECGINPKIHAYNKSKGEVECRDYIRSLGFFCDSYKFEKKYEIDCYSHETKFGVEYCGEYWHRYSPSKKNKMYHKEKTLFFEERGIHLMTIFESEWKSNKRNILESMIKVRLGLIEEKIHARKCVIKTVDRKTAELFHNENHVSGKTNSSINYGLYYKDNLISVLSLIKSRFDKGYEYEISRFSSNVNTVVVGGLSKLFKHFVKEVNPSSCMTYSDLRFGQGLSYGKIGFEYIGSTPPNYHYYNKNVGILESRMKYQKSKLIDLPEYNVNKTEMEIMSDAGYFVIYDCGSKKYGWKNPTHTV